MLYSGMMIAPSLVRALWKNPREEHNGKDDDGNGYVDDLFGWDFGARSFYSLGDSAQLPHGSMCAGIVAGRPLNKKKIVTGIAPRSRVMPLRGMGYLKAYEYALEQGADVISMSYMWVNQDLGNYRGVYRTAHEHLAAAGVVSVGGAGNFAQLGKGKQIALPKDIPCVIAAAGIQEDDSKAPASSEGPCYWDGVKFYSDYPEDRPLSKPDVTGCFGGYPVWGRPLRVRPNWQIVWDEGGAFALVIGPQGNSFSGPHAAGVAALMFSANPDLNAWEVKDLMEKTCKDIGPGGRDTQFGAGLLQALDAVRAAKQVQK
jgi:subtilisin family serine protease